MKTNNIDWVGLFRKGSLFLGLGVSMLGCASRERDLPAKTQLQIREFQTRTFDDPDLKIVMKSALNVLQDDGFIIRNVNLDLGFLNASKEVDIEKSGDRFWASFLGSSQAPPVWKKLSVIECTVNVTTIGTQNRVRVNFQSKIYNNLGNVIQVRQLEDSQFYQEFFAKMDKGIFLQKNNI